MRCIFAWGVKMSCAAVPPLPNPTAACAARAHPLDAWVQVAPPAAHALLVGAAITVACNLCPAPHTKGLDQLNQLGVLISSPLVTPDVGVDLNNVSTGSPMMVCRARVEETGGTILSAQRQLGACLLHTRAGTTPAANPTACAVGDRCGCHSASSLRAALNTDAACAVFLLQT